MSSVFLNAVRRAQAHGAEADAKIEATMRIDPDGHPIVGKEANFYFTFQDPNGNFEIKRCDCVIILLKDEQEIDRQLPKFTDTAFSALGTQPLYSKVFDAAGDYELQFVGSPKDGAIFEPFELHYDVEVTSQYIDHILIFGGVLVVAIILLARNYLQNRRQKKGATAPTENINQ